MKNNCTHEKITSRWISEYNDWTGEYDSYWDDKIESLYEDISLGRFKCTRCGHVGYYTGLWKNYYEKGIPCAGSDQVYRRL